MWKKTDYALYVSTTADSAMPPNYMSLWGSYSMCLTQTPTLLGAIHQEVVPTPLPIYRVQRFIPTEAATLIKESLFPAEAATALKQLIWYLDYLLFWERPGRKPEALLPQAPLGIGPLLQKTGRVLNFKKSDTGLYSALEAGLLKLNVANPTSKYDPFLFCAGFDLHDAVSKDLHPLHKESLGVNTLLGYSSPWGQVSFRKYMQALSPYDAEKPPHQVRRGFLLNLNPKYLRFQRTEAPICTVAPAPGLGFVLEVQMGATWVIDPTAHLILENFS